MILFFVMESEKSIDSGKCDEGGSIKLLRDWLGLRKDIELVVLIGSRTTGLARPDSDWDLAVVWAGPASGILDFCGRAETLCREISVVLGVSSERIDLIDLASARLAIRAAIAQDGILLKGAESLYWMRFLTKTWRELEEFEWEKTHAA